MRKGLFLVLIGLTIVSFSAFGTGGQDSRGQLTGSNRRGVAEGSDIAEVPERSYHPRQNPQNKRAGTTVEKDIKARGDIYAYPATALNPEAERLPPPVFAIAGVKNQEINETAWLDEDRNITLEVVDIVVLLPQNEKFSRSVLEGADVSEWVLNLPKGLEARAHRVKKNARTVKIYISGKPEETMRDTIRVTIPGEFIASGKNLEFASPTEIDSLRAWEKQLEQKEKSEE